MPYALERKYPRAGQSWAWFWVFPQDHLSTDPRTGVIRRHRLYDQTFQRAFKRALAQANIAKPATPPGGKVMPEEVQQSLQDPGLITAEQADGRRRLTMLGNKARRGAVPITIKD